MRQSFALVPTPGYHDMHLCTVTYALGPLRRNNGIGVGQIVTTQAFAV